MPRVLRPRVFLFGSCVLALLSAGWLAERSRRAVHPTVNVRKSSEQNFAARRTNARDLAVCAGTAPEMKTSQERTEQDPQAAWIRATARPPQDESTWQQELASITEKDVDLAWSLAAELAAARPEVAQIAYAVVLDTLAQRGNYARAKAGLQRLPQSEMKDHLVTNLVLQWGRDDPLAAAEWLLSIPVSSARTGAFAQLGKAWAEVRPQEAAEILLRLPAGELRRQSITAALTAWIEQSPAAASAWLAQLEPDPDLDLVAARIARVPQLVQTRVDVALGWAESIVDGNERVQALGSIVVVWADRDRAAAVRYVQQAPSLTPAQRASLLDELGALPAPL